MNLSDLISVVTKEGRISEHEIVNMISQKADSGEDFSPLCLFRMIYSKVYGETISKELAQMIVKKFAVTDNSGRQNGERWTIEQTTELGESIGIDWSEYSKIDFYVVCNMMASDFSKLAERVGYSEDSKFFGYMAKEWLEDEDIPHSKKLFKYLFYVVM